MQGHLIISKMPLEQLQETPYFKFKHSLSESSKASSKIPGKVFLMNLCKIINRTFHTSMLQCHRVNIPF